MTMIAANTTVPAYSFYSGSPAKKTDLPPGHITTQVNEPVAAKEKTLRYALWHYAAFILVGIIHYAAYYPSILLLGLAESQTHSIVYLIFTIPLAAALALFIYYAATVILKWLLISSNQPNHFSIYSMQYIRQWMLIKLMDADEISVLSDSLYLPFLLRLLGAKIGRFVELGLTPHLLPHLLTVEEQGFAASDVGFAWPSIFRGQVQLAPVRLGKGSFIGNCSMQPAGFDIGESCLLGCMTRPPHNKEASRNQTNWLGSPPVYLPKREVFTGYSDEETTNPSKTTYCSRLLMELIRIILPTTLNTLGLVLLYNSLDYLLQHYSSLEVACILPVVEASLVLSLVSGLIALKWIVQGRLQPTVKPLWDIYIRKIDLIEYSWSYFIGPNLNEIIVGTPFIGLLLRCFGSKIGKKVFIQTDSFAEFGLIQVDDEACVNINSIMDTHLYEDRIFKTSTIRISKNCNIGVYSMVLYDTVMEENSTLGSLSLLMKGEKLLSNTRWEGVPAQAMEPKDKVLLEAPAFSVSNKSCIDLEAVD